MKTSDYTTTAWAVIFYTSATWRHPYKWKTIRRLLTQEGLDYTPYVAVGYGEVEQLARKLILEGYTSLVVVGGDSAFNCLLKGLLSCPVAMQDKVAISLIPYGVGNDFARFWLLDEKDYSALIHALAQRRIRRIDVGYCIYKSKKGKRKKRPFVNCVNIGLTAQIIHIYHAARRFWGVRLIAFCWSVFLLLFQRKTFHLQMTVNEEVVDTEAMMLCVGNCLGYGQTPSAVPYNGWLDISVTGFTNIRQLSKGLWLLSSSRYLNHENVLPYRTRKVEINKTAHAPVAIDGYILSDITYPLGITIRKERVNFILID